MKILILGGSSGIGKQFVIELSKNNKVVAVSKDYNDLLKLKNQLMEYSIEIDIYKADLTNKNELTKVCNKYIDYDMVINSAGIGRLGDITKTDIFLEENNIDLNVKAFYYITKTFANTMIKRKNGIIINVCSSASFTPMPNFNLYAATKAFCGSYTISAAKECEKYGVYIMALCPGPTYTNFLSKEQFDSLKNKYKINGIIMKPEDVVKKALKAIKKRKKIYIPGFINKFIYYFDKYMPISFIVHIIYKLYININEEVDKCE